MDGTVSRAFLTGGTYARTHLDYPLLVPLSVSWIYTAMGGAFETAAKIIYPLQFVSLLVIFNYGAGRLAGRRVALVFTALLSMTPLVMTHAAGLPVKVGILYSGDFAGYADLALALYFLSAGVFLSLYASEGKEGWFVLCALMLGMGAWTKNEGAPFELTGGLALLTLAALRRVRANTLALGAAGVLAFSLPWLLYKTYLGIGSEYGARLNINTAGENLYRIGPIVKYLGSYMFGYNGLYSFAWWAFFISTAANVRGLLNKKTGLLCLLIAAQLLVYVLIYVITPSGLDWHVRTSMDRLLLHVLPLSMLVTAANVHGLMERYL
ncbi:MAG: hypothetical protein HY894_08190 [Deltaproteobacteria bacterium]|nr:hypothetical protein [Deltaproteobacteria bacterium]